MKSGQAFPVVFLVACSFFGTDRPVTCMQSRLGDFTPKNLWPTPLRENKKFRKIWKEKTPYQANRTNQLADPSRYIHPVYLVFGQAWRPRCNLSWPRVKWKVLASFICLLHYTQYISFKLISRAHKELCLCCRQLSNPSHNPETKFFCQIQCHLLGRTWHLTFRRGLSGNLPKWLVYAKTLCLCKIETRSKSELNKNSLAILATRAQHGKIV